MLALKSMLFGRLPGNTRDGNNPAFSSLFSGEVEVSQYANFGHRFIFPGPQPNSATGLSPKLLQPRLERLCH